MQAPHALRYEFGEQPEPKLDSARPRLWAYAHFADEFEMALTLFTGGLHVRGSGMPVLV
jgi:hypothetical protein